MTQGLLGVKKLFNLYL